MNDFVPIELVRRPLDRFRCDPYHAVITAQTCLMRQERCARGTNAELLRRGHEGGDYARCTPECPLGAKIRPFLVHSIYFTPSLVRTCPTAMRPRSPSIASSSRNDRPCRINRQDS